MKYPYLGMRKFDDKQVTILFTELGKGVVVDNQTQDDEYRFGRYGEFDEDEYDFLPQNVCVRLNN